MEFAIGMAALVVLGTVIGYLSGLHVATEVRREELEDLRQAELDALRARRQLQLDQPQEHVIRFIPVKSHTRAPKGWLQ